MKAFNRIAELFFTMLKIGLFTFGGGYAMIALLQNELIEKKQWISREDFSNMLAIAESTPGPIAINAATYIGFRQAGVLGAVSATVAVSIPSFVIVYLISLFFDAFLALTPVAYAFRGIQACVIYLILSAGWSILKEVPRRPLETVLLVLTVGVMLTCSLLAVKFSTVFYILIGGAVGLFCLLLQKLRGGDR